MKIQSVNDLKTISRGHVENLYRPDVIRVNIGMASCGIAAGVFWGFAVGGESALRAVRVDPEAMRVFGGVIFFVVGYNYATKGYKAAVLLRGSLEELPSAIALPFMIGAGTITQSILIGKEHGPLLSLPVVAGAVLVAFLIVVGFRLLHDRMRGHRERLFERYVNLLARINGLLIGAISTNMVIGSAHALWQAS